MFCRNCGKEIHSENEICRGCGFRGSNGNKFCPNCGKEVLPGQAMCLSCGRILDEQEPQVTQSTPSQPVNKDDKKQQYRKYCDTVKKNNILSLAMQIISLLLLLCLIFLPIYKRKFEPSAEDIENFEQLGEVLENGGYLEENFSLFDDIKLLVGQLFSGEDSGLGVSNFLIVLCVGMFALFEVIFAIVLICMSISAIPKLVSSIKNNDEATMLAYNEIKKSGNQSKKENVMKKQTVMSVLLYAIFDVIEARMFGDVLYGDVVALSEVRKMATLSGVSGLIVIVALLLGCYLVANIMKKKETDRMILDITKTEYTEQ